MAMAPGMNPMAGMGTQQGGGGLKAALDKAKQDYMQAAQTPASSPVQLKQKNAMLSELAGMIQNMEKMLTRSTAGAGQ